MELTVQAGVTHQECGMEVVEVLGKGGSRFHLGSVISKTTREDARGRDPDVFTKKTKG